MIACGTFSRDDPSPTVQLLAKFPERWQLRVRWTIAWVRWLAVTITGRWWPFARSWSWGYGWKLELRGNSTRFPDYPTPYTVETERKKLDALLAQ